MAFLTKYGNQWGALPMGMGNIYWVAPTTHASAASGQYVIEGRTYSASDSNDGLSPERAVATVTHAVALSTANADDTIVLLPGTHTVSAALVPKAGTTFVGLPYFPDQRSGSRPRPNFRPKAILTQSTATTVTVALAAADVTFANITLRPITGAAFMTVATAAARCTVRDCFIDMKTPTGAAGTKGIIALTSTDAPEGLHICGSLFLEGNGGTSNGIMLEIGASVNAVIEGCSFLSDGTVASHATYTTAIQCQDNCSAIFRDNDIIGMGGTITNGIRGVTHTGAGIVHLYGNRVSANVTNPFTNWASGDCNLDLNYVATVAAGTGGTLITSTT